MKRSVAKFSSEADLCQTFSAEVRGEVDANGRPRRQPKQSGWTVYAETAGWDLLLSRDADGFQIGVEAKLHLNETVIRQALDQYSDPLSAGPDCYAVLVPEGSGGTLMDVVARAVGVTVIRCRSSKREEHEGSYSIGPLFHPWLPEIGERGYWTMTSSWFERMPVRRCKLPDYVPDVVGGRPAPLKLTEWKIGALKVAAVIDLKGFVTRADFKHIGIDHRRWTENRWIEIGPAGWVKGAYWPDFAGQHPTNFEQIKADFEEWKPAELLP